MVIFQVAVAQISRDPFNYVQNNYAVFLLMQKIFFYFVHLYFYATQHHTAALYSHLECE